VLTTAVLDSVVAELNDAWAQSGMIEPPSRRYPGFGLDDGYYVGACILREQIAAGRVATGKKLGFTNQAVWAQVGLDQPFWAPIYRDSLRRAAELDVTGMVQPRIEPEIVLALKSDLSDPELSAAEILSAVEWCALGFEIVACHYPGWSFAPADAIADRGLHAALIVGEPTPIHSASEDLLAGLTVTLFLNGAARAAGRASNVLGSPALALGWLLKILVRTGQHGIRAGEVITTGSLTDAPYGTWKRREVCRYTRSPFG